MKYIRTENGHIYEYVEQRIYPSQYTKFGLYRYNLNSDYEQIIAQADTIEELCDSFVIRENKKNKISLFSISNGFETAKEWAVDRGYKNYEILGAIWTDKGLIYVAKVNDKGELELI